jgi:hypothetical protein
MIFRKMAPPSSGAAFWPKVWGFPGELSALFAADAFVSSVFRAVQKVRPRILASFRVAKGFRALFLPKGSFSKTTRL